jgi:hypothetical protein
MYERRIYTSRMKVKDHASRTVKELTEKRDTNISVINNLGEHL